MIGIQPLVERLGAKLALQAFGPVDARRRPGDISRVGLTRRRGGGLQLGGGKQSRLLGAGSTGGSGARRGVGLRRGLGSGHGHGLGVGVRHRYTIQGVRGRNIHVPYFSAMDAMWTAVSVKNHNLSA